MPLRRSRSRGLAATLFITSAMAEFTHDQFHAPIEKRAWTPTEKGCYSSAAGFESQGTDIYQSSGNCGPICYNLQKPVMALFNKNECFCGDLLPASSSKTVDGNCDQQCNGYPESCGGTAAYTVFLTGIDDNVGSVEEEEPFSSVVPVVSSAAPTSSIALTYKPVAVPTSIVVTKPTVVTSARTEVKQPTTIINGQQTIVKTLAPATQTVEAPASVNQGASSESSNPIGIAVGVVVGVLVLAALIVFGVFYTRRRRRMKNAENGHARADSLNAFVAQGGSLPGTGLANDTRLDPRIMVERRRMSNGSIADNQDYSRRILKVANPSDD